jgi:hypothetical protein
MSELIEDGKQRGDGRVSDEIFLNIRRCIFWKWKRVQVFF